MGGGGGGGVVAFFVRTSIYGYTPRFFAIANPFFLKLPFKQPQVQLLANLNIVQIWDSGYRTLQITTPIISVLLSTRS